MLVLLRPLLGCASLAGVFFGSDFVTITKDDDYNWPVLKPDVFAAIMDHFSSGEPLFTDKDTLAASDTAIHEDDDEVRGPAAAALVLLLRAAQTILAAGAGYVPCPCMHTCHLCCRQAHYHITGIPYCRMLCWLVWRCSSKC